MFDKSVLIGLSFKYENTIFYLAKVLNIIEKVKASVSQTHN